MVVSLAALLGIQTDFLWVEKSEHSLVELGLMLAGSKVDLDGLDDGCRDGATEGCDDGCSVGALVGCDDG